MPGEVGQDRREWVLAVDLGQSIDPTAIAVIEHRVAEAFAVDARERWSRSRTISERFDVRHLQRLPLGLSYPEQVAEVGRLLARPPLSTSGCALVIDETGVGRAVGDIFVADGLKPTRVSITAGDAQSLQGRGRWTVAKSILISTLDARLHTGELRFASGLSDADALADELKDFRRKVSAAGRYSYEARVGKHDDLVLAVAIGLWFFVGRPKPGSTSTQAVVGCY